MMIGDSTAPRVVVFPKQTDPELERIHAAAAAGDYRHYAGPDRPREPHPPLAGGDYVQMRWPGHAHLDLKDTRDPRRQIPHARRAIERARAKAGLFADLQEWPTPEERVASFRECAERARARERSACARDLIRVRARLRELPQHVRRAVIVAWNARTLPADHLIGFIDRFLRGEITPVPELVLPADLLILGCTATRDPSETRMPARRRYIGEALRLAGGDALLGRGLSVAILTAELGLLHTWESERDGRVLGPVGPSLTPARAAEMVQEAEAASAFFHAVIVGPGNEVRPPYRRVLVGGSALHQEVVEAWERADVFRGAEVVFLPPCDAAQREALAGLYGIGPVATARGSPVQLPLL